MPIPYNNNIPDAPNDPSADQPKMRTNTNSTDAIIAIDHYTFADAPAGQHKQVVLAGKNAQGAQTDPSSAVYSASGTASSVSNLIYRNQNGVFPLNCVRAWGLVTGGVGPAVVASQSVNVSAVARSAVGKYTVTLTANAVSTANFAVIACSTLTTSSVGTQVGYVLTGIGTFELNFVTLSGNAFVDPTQFSFMVLQI